MAITTVPTLGPDPFTVNASVLNGKVDPLVTDYNGNIDNNNIATAAAIANSKLNLAAISQNIAHSGTMTHTGTVTITGKDLTEAKSADIASATTTTIWTTDGNFAHITGTTTITGFGTAGQAGDRRIICFDGILTLTHNSTSLILPTGANITTAVGDTAIVLAETTANARVVAYMRKDGTALTSSSPTVADQSAMETATNNTSMVTPLGVNWHPGVAKCLGSFNGSGTPAFNTGGRYNFDASITDNGAGDWTLAITTDFSSAVWFFFGTAMDISSDYNVVNINSGGMAAGTIRVIVGNIGGTPKDPTTVCVAGFGDQ